GVSSDPADGRHRRPPVPRIRDGDFDRNPDLTRDLAVDHADDVLGPAPLGTRPGARAPLSCQRGLLQLVAWPLPALAGGGTATSTLGDGDPGRGARPEPLPLRRHPERILSAAGHRPSGWSDPGRSKHFVPTDAAEARRIRRYRQK